MSGAPPEAAHARLAWRCRRGTRELDLLLQRWLARGYAAADAAQRALFETLLALPDPELADYLLGGVGPPEPPLATLVEAIRATATYPQAPDAVLCPAGVTGTSGPKDGPTSVCTSVANG